MAHRLQAYGYRIGHVTDQLSWSRICTCVHSHSHTYAYARSVVDRCERAHIISEKIMNRMLGQTH